MNWVEKPFFLVFTNKIFRCTFSSGDTFSLATHSGASVHPAWLFEKFISRKSKKLFSVLPEWIPKWAGTSKKSGIGWISLKNDCAQNNARKGSGAAALLSAHLECVRATRIRSAIRPHHGGFWARGRLRCVAAECASKKKSSTNGSDGESPEEPPGTKATEAPATGA